MRKRGVRGPAAFLVAFGVSVALLGPLNFLAIPAANRLDKIESLRTGVPPKNPRAGKIALGATIALVSGIGFIVWGLYLHKKARS